MTNPTPSLLRTLAPAIAVVAAMWALIGGAVFLACLVAEVLR